MKYIAGQVVTPLIVTKREKSIWGMYEGIPMTVVKSNNVEVIVDLQGRQVVYPIHQVKLLDDEKGKKLDKDYPNLPASEIEKLKLLKL